MSRYHAQWRRSALLATGLGGAALLLGSAHAQSPTDEPTVEQGPEPTVSADPGPMQRATASSEQIGAGTLMNPSISVILDGVYGNEFSGHVDDPGGFGMGHSHGHGHDHAHGIEDGFQLRETEIAFEASVDPYFDAFAMLVIEGTDHIDLEEAYFTTRSLPWGLQVKAGRFLSDVGYINSQHPHEWDFVDRPLVSEHLFGDHGIQEIGAQLNWLAPTRTYLKFGAEILEGETSGIAAYEGETSTQPGWIDNTSDNDDTEPGRFRTEELDLPFSDSTAPRLATLFAKWGPDLGFNHAAQFGISGGYAQAWQRIEEHSEGLRVEAWDGDAWFAGLDAVYKFDPPGSYQGTGQLTLQGEYFYRNIDADYYYYNSDFERDEVDSGEGYWQRDTASADRTSGRFKQDGLYVQAVYGIAPRWRTGIRAEALGLLENQAWHDRDDGNGYADLDTSYRYSANVTFYPSHFSYIRAQVNYSDFAADSPGGSGEDAWQAMLQYNLSLGAHGAHPF
ncbi:MULTISPECIES: zinc-regulated TonB-dependent outer membrane receptor [unclassified Halorhodospira]|uniref:zinc-regulated TonB-dependent outer membrane receptor n=1 Tax=unclassified Halorhodospira TaxID=2626748 RepID=UPI001EE7FA4C|nr:MULTISPECIES: zinc-regulated TonB-dependent outer membrane receptor [unclassified Halorhodospira]MCG5541178.1 zinc-regulated TonB-dependent outer membrane receptor [Halorhodospira sp. M39old]MCG5545620.1 zinc-regulated TonB-dependent outer membrane receptor [Halorhodospira sp. M38]